MEKIRVLLLEDYEEDKELLLMELRRGGFDPEYKWIQTEEQLVHSLHEQSWDLILSDYSMPGFDGLTALRITRDLGLDTPFILITGALGEELAVEIMREGANDYLIKSNLNRLLPAIERELKQATNRKKHREAENDRRRLLKVIHQSLNEIYIFNSETLKIEYANDAALVNLGYSLEELIQLTPLDLKTNIDSNHFSGLLTQLQSGQLETIILNTYHQRKDKTRYPVETHIQLIIEENQNFFAAITLDLTTQKKDAKIIEKQKILTRELELSSKYKSEFLANMSHELRTPLNSIILLSKLLVDKQSGNLTTDQIDYLNVIHKSGNNLHELINDILDISKIEAGEMSFQINPVKVDDIILSVIKPFEPLAARKGVDLVTQQEVEPDLMMKTDRLRVEQILKNFLSNAFKFTNTGSVCFSIFQPKDEALKHWSGSNQNLIAFCVKDTGIGIPESKKEIIFEAFQQVDGSIQREFQGTGLGLSISNQLTSFLGGKITVESTLGEGSEFTVYLPLDSSPYVSHQKSPDENPADTAAHVQSQCTNTTSDNNTAPAAKKPGKQKAGRKKVKHLLLVDDSDIHISALKELIDSEDKICLTAGTAKEMHQVLKSATVDLIVLDLGLPDMDGFDVIRNIKLNSDFQRVPIIVYSGRSMPESKKKEFQHLVYRFITKTSGSYQMLNAAIEQAFETKSKRPQTVPGSSAAQVLKDKKVLIVDDHNRNIYSLTKALEAFRMQVISASNGKEGLKVLKNNSDIDLVLMDMMMPVMNGYDTISAIRKNPAWENLPIVAVTAKAMQKDKEKCLEAGASDYMAKPVNIDKLIALLTIWLDKDISLFSP